MLVLYLGLFFNIHAVFTSELDTKINEDSPAISSSTNVTITVSNLTEIGPNKQLPVMERFTQPILQMERNLSKVLSNSTESANGTGAANRSSAENHFQEFKPSPHLGTYFEHNPYPVKPALPEAKTSRSHYAVWNDIPATSLVDNPNKNTNIWTEKPNVPTWMDKQSIQSPWEQNVWTENPHQPLKSSVDSGRVKFPISGHDRPYQFVSHNENQPLFGYPVTTERFAFNKPVRVPQTPQKSTPSFWNTLLGYNGVQNKVPESALQKTFYDYNLLEKPPHNNYYEFPKEHAYSVDHYQPFGGYAVNPWKKVIKFLAALIPIGLFVSALTPTVITVSQANDTQARYRHEESKEHNIAKHLSSSLTYFDNLNHDGCEDKVLCELLVSASFSKNAEKHIRNLLDNFIQQEDLQNKKGDLMKIFEAVKNQDCSPISCGNLKNPT